MVGWTVLSLLACAVVSASADHVSATQRIEVSSTKDGQTQPCLLVSAPSSSKRPLLVALHPWSHGVDTFNAMTNWEQAARKRGWHYLQPHFRGPNRTPQACASELARQDVLDAVDYVVAHWSVDTHRIYLAGCSGGGHMALVMAARAHERWAAVSAWCPITDLAAWHAESQRLGRAYHRDLEAVCGGAPSASLEVDEQYRQRSSLPYLSSARGLPIDIYTGIHDGHTGSVPIHHAIDAFNVIAHANGNRLVSDADIATLSLEQPLNTPAEQDETLGRHIFLRRNSGATRITVFEGGHEGDALADAACRWLARHKRPAAH